MYKAEIKMLTYFERRSMKATTFTFMRNLIDEMVEDIMRTLPLSFEGKFGMYPK